MYTGKRLLIQEQETQSTKNTHSAKQKKLLSDLGYKLFMQYYNKLTGLPSLVELTSHFVAANIISSFDGEAITSAVITKSQTAALRKLLTKMLTVSHNDHKSFYKMLKIMQAYGDSATKLLATEVLEKILESISNAPNENGKCSCIAISVQCNSCIV